MRSILHIVTDSNRETLQAVVDGQKAEANVKVDLVDLTHGSVNYDELLEKIFSADSVQVW